MFDLGVTVKVRIGLGLTRAQQAEGFNTPLSFPFRDGAKMLALFAAVFR